MSNSIKQLIVINKIGYKKYLVQNNVFNLQPCKVVIEHVNDRVPQAGNNVNDQNVNTTNEFTKSVSRCIEVQDDKDVHSK